MDNTNDCVAFTRGDWATVAIPFLSGIFEAGKNSFYLVSVGFEVEKILRAVSRVDPDRVSLLVADPAVSPEYECRSLEVRADIINEFQIPDSQIVRSHASDAVGTWSKLMETELQREATENGFYLCCGTKPHALALALTAFVKGHPAVLYNVP